MVEFLRRNAARSSKLGKRRKKEQKWRKPTGRHNKMREKKRGNPLVVSIGYGQNKKVKGMINEKQPVLVRNIADLNKIKQKEIIIFGKIGNKKKIELAQKAKEKKIEVYGLDIEKFLKKNVKKGNKKLEGTTK